MAADEFFAAKISNPHTRRAYARPVGRFLAWCEAQGIEQPAAGAVAAEVVQQIRAVDRPYLIGELEGANRPPLSSDNCPDGRIVSPFQLSGNAWYVAYG